MPTYEYKNTETGERYEFKQSMKDAALTHHPETGEAIRRIVSRPAIAFKGSGFYANDSRSSPSTSGTKKAEASPSESASQSGKAESSGSEKSGGEKAPSEKAAPAATPTPSSPAKSGE